ncbi:hypothetical protein ACFL4O_01595 [bacterium]
MSIYDNAISGTQVWSKEFSGLNKIQVSSGVFTCALDPDIDWRSKNYWIETIVSGKVLSPRNKITAQAYALHSNTAEEISKTSGEIYFSIGDSTYTKITTQGIEVKGNIKGEALEIENIVIGTILETGNLKIYGDIESTGTIKAGTGDSNNWNKAYTERMQWDGTSTVLDADTGRTSLELGDMALQNKNEVEITGGYIKEISSITVTNDVEISGDLKVTGGIETGTLKVGGKEFSSTNEIYWTSSTAVSGSIYYSGGNVGIGIENPTKELEVNGTVKALMFEGDGSGLTNIGASAVQSTSLEGAIQVHSSITENKLYIDEDGNIGIGTQSPKGKLSIQGSFATPAYYEHSRIIFNNEDKYGIAGGMISGSTDLDLYIWSAKDSIGKNKDIRFMSTSNGASNPDTSAWQTNMIIKGYSGNIGIGLTDPQYKLDINGSLKIQTGSIYFADGTSMSTAYTGQADKLENNLDAEITADADDNSSGEIKLNIGTSTKAKITDTGLDVTDKLKAKEIEAGTSDTTGSLKVYGNIESTGTIKAGAGDSSKWNEAYTHRLKWDGAGEGLDAETGRTSLELGGMAVQDKNKVEITGGYIKEISSITVIKDVEIGGDLKVTGGIQTGTLIDDFKHFGHLATALKAVSGQEEQKGFSNMVNEIKKTRLQTSHVDESLFKDRVDEKIKEVSGSFEKFKELTNFAGEKAKKLIGKMFQTSKDDTIIKDIDKAVGLFKKDKKAYTTRRDVIIVKFLSGLMGRKLNDFIYEHEELESKIYRDLKKTVKNKSDEEISLQAHKKALVKQKKNWGDFYEEIEYLYWKMDELLKSYDSKYGILDLQDFKNVLNMVIEKYGNEELKSVGLDAIVHEFAKGFLKAGMNKNKELIINVADKNAGAIKDPQEKNVRVIYAGDLNAKLSARLKFIHDKSEAMKNKQGTAELVLGKDTLTTIQKGTASKKELKDMLKLVKEQKLKALAYSGSGHVVCGTGKLINEKLIDWLYNRIGKLTKQSVTGKDIVQYVNTFELPIIIMSKLYKDENVLLKECSKYFSSIGLSGKVDKDKLKKLIKDTKQGILFNSNFGLVSGKTFTRSVPWIRQLTFGKAILVSNNEKVVKGQITSDMQKLTLNKDEIITLELKEDLSVALKAGENLIENYKPRLILDDDAVNLGIFVKTLVRVKAANNVIADTLKNIGGGLAAALLSGHIKTIKMNEQIGLNADIDTQKLFEAVAAAA